MVGAIYPILHCQYCSAAHRLGYDPGPGEWIYTCPACIREPETPPRFVPDLTRHREETRAARRALARLRLEFEA